MRRLSDDALRGIPMGGKKIKGILYDIRGNTCFLGASGIGFTKSLKILKSLPWTWVNCYSELYQTEAI